MIKHFDINHKGRDFVVGDIHGCFDKLSKRLSDIGFDCDQDRLFSVGDLIDRGENSADAHKWIHKPWFHAVRGNHEQMAIDTFYGRLDASNYWVNGGEWFLRLTQEEQTGYVNVFEAMPYVIDIQTNHGLVGIVHAEYPFDDWLHDINLDDNNRDRFEDKCLWSRSRITRMNDVIINGIGKVYVGHTPINNPIVLGNTVYIDTGAVFGGALTIMEI